MSEEKLSTEFVPFKETKLLIEMGFKTKNYFAHYQGERGSFKFGDPSQHRDRVKRIGAPLWQQVFKYFAKEHRLDIYIYKNDDGMYYPVLRDKSMSYYNDTIPEEFNDARITGIRKLIELVKKKQELLTEKPNEDPVKSESKKKLKEPLNKRQWLKLI